MRFYEQEGVLPAPGREHSGYRDYEECAVDRLSFVKAAQAAGLTLAEIRQVITVREQDGPPCNHVIALLDTHAAELDRRIADLTALRDQVLGLLERSKDLDPAQCSATSVCDIIGVADRPSGRPQATLRACGRDPAATFTHPLTITRPARARGAADGRWVPHCRAAAPLRPVYR